MKKSTKIGLGILVGLIVLGGFACKNGNGGAQEIITVTKGDIIEEVSVTGRVKASQEVQLAFDRSGRVIFALQGVGKQVKKGDVVVSLERNDLLAQLDQARAGVESAQATVAQYEATRESYLAKLSELKKGTRVEELNLQNVKITNAENSLEEAKKNVINQLRDAYAKADDAVRNKVDQFFLNPRSTNAQLVFTTLEPELKSSLELKRIQLEASLVSWKKSIDALVTVNDMSTALLEGRTVLTSAESLLEVSVRALNRAIFSSTVNQTNVDTWKTDATTGRTNVNTALTALSTVEDKLKTAESTLKVEKNELTILLAGTAPDQISAQEALVKQIEATIAMQEAAVKQAQANVRQIEAQVEKTVLRSPFDGMLTKQEAKVGEIVTANAIVASLLSDAQFEIEANVPEADITKLAVGDAAQVTLDAYGNGVVFDAVVLSIEPAETFIDGVATYKTKFQLAKKDDRIKSGMTALSVVSKVRRTDVLVVPQRVIITRDEGTVVRVPVEKEYKEVPVVIGARGSNGMVEIVSGLEEGAQVLYTK